MYRSLARWCYRRHWTVIAVWMLALIGINIAGVAIGAANEGEFESPASESTAGFETLQQYFPGASSGFGGSIVFQSADGIRSPDIEAAMTALFAEVEEFDGVTVISPYSELGANQVAADGTIAFAQINLDNLHA